MVLEKECQQKKVEKLYQTKEKKVEKKYLYKKFFFSKKMKLKKLNGYFYKKKKFKYLIIKNKHNKFSYSRIGIIIKKKNIKLAVKRNKIRRIIYETFRLKQYKIKNIDYLLIINKNILNIKNIFFFLKKYEKNTINKTIILNIKKWTS